MITIQQEMISQTVPLNLEREEASHEDMIKAGAELFLLMEIAE